MARDTEREPVRGKFAVYLKVYRTGGSVTPEEMRQILASCGLQPGCVGGFFNKPPKLKKVNGKFCLTEVSLNQLKNLNLV